MQLFISFQFGLIMQYLVPIISATSGGLESLMFALALAVGLTPELLPMIVTVTGGTLRRSRDVAGLAMEVGAIFRLNNLKAIWCGQNRWYPVAITL
jgi:hypothetical protein